MSNGTGHPVTDSKALDAMLAPAAAAAAMDPSGGRAYTPNNMHAPSGVSVGGDFGDFNNEVFDPLNWVLDGVIDMPGFDLSGMGADVGGNGLMDQGMGL